MPLPVIANVFRVTLEWNSFQGVSARNVIHIRAAAATSDDVFDAINTFMGGGVNSQMFNALPNGAACTRITILPLDGTTAGIAYTLTNGWSGGAGAGTDVVAQGCAVVSLRTGLRGPSGRGRVYAGPVSEAAQVSGVLDSIRRSTMLSGWEAFQSALTANSPSMTQVVASYVHASSATVTNYSVDNVLGTQRKRIDQLR